MPYLVLCFLVWMLSPALAGAANTHGLPTIQEEQQAWWGEAGGGFAVSGCLAVANGGGPTTETMAACRAYVRTADTEASPPYRLEYVADTTSRTISYSGGDGTYWLIIHASTTDSVGGWTRSPVGSPYLWQKSATFPGVPNRALLLEEVTLAGGAITRRKDRRASNPGPRGVYHLTDPLYGVVLDSTANQRTAIQTAINAACDSGGGTVVFPQGTVYITGSALDLDGPNDDCVGLTLAGKSPSGAVLRTTAAIGLLDYSPASLREARLTVRDLFIFGERSTSGMLITTTNGAGVYLDNLHVRGSTTDCINTAGTYDHRYANMRVEDCGGYSINIHDGANVFTLDNVDLNGSPSGGLGSLRIHSTITGMVSGTNFEGAGQLTNGVVLDGAAEIAFIGNFFELYTNSAVVAVNTPSTGINFRNNFFNGSAGQIVDFSPGGLAHQFIEVINNRYGANTGLQVLFDPGAATAYTFCFNSAENAPAAYIAGINVNNRCATVGPNTVETVGRLIRDDNALTWRYDGTVAIGTNATANLTRSGEALSLNSGHATGTLQLRTAGGDRLTVSAAGIVAVKGSSTDFTATPDNTGVVLGLSELSGAPAAPAANTVKIYAKDTGGGKTTLCARFATGSEQCFATEP